MGLGRLRSKCCGFAVPHALALPAYFSHRFGGLDQPSPPDPEQGLCTLQMQELRSWLRILLNPATVNARKAATWNAINSTT
jgi:hypothetical protein